MVYWLLFLFIMYCLIGFYDKSKNKNRLLFFIILIAVYFSTFRDGLGTDYTGYKSYCESTRSYVENWLLMEPFPMWIYTFCYNSKFSAIVFFFITSALTCGISIWVYSRYKNFWIAAFVFLTYTNLYLASFNLVRQFVASSFILLGTYLFVIKKKSPWFFLFVILASLWHKSAFLTFFIYFLNDKKINPIGWILFIILSWIVPANMLLNIPFLGDALNILDYSGYLTYNKDSYTSTSIVNLYMHFIILYFLLVCIQKRQFQFEGQKGFYVALKLSVLSIIFCNISANSIPFAYRFAIFFSTFIPILFSYLPLIVGKNTTILMVAVPIFILLMTVLTLHIDDRLFCPQRILPIESVYDEYYNPYENPDVILVH